jgi:hypothetical protein
MRTVLIVLALAAKMEPPALLGQNIADRGGE